MKKPKSKRKQIVIKLDDVFQVYVRWRDGWKCITCGAKVDPYSETAKRDMHAGHYIDRGNYKTRWDEVNVNAQCRICNGKEHWTKDKSTYALKMLKKYGLEALESLESRKNGISGHSISDLEEMCEHYTRKLNEIKGH